MKSLLRPLEEQLDSIKETRFCIEQSREYIENQKKEQFLNKLTFRYSLSKINKEKMYGMVIPQANRMYPRLSYEGGRFTAHQYSSPRIRQNRRSFILYKQQPLPEHKEEIKRYSQLLNKKKQGGLDSFWIFKKPVQSQDKKTRVKKQQNTTNSNARETVNRVQQAYANVFIWGKLPVDLQSGLLNKNLLKNYVASIIGECFAEWLISFFQIRSYINYKEFRSIGQRFANMSVRFSHLVSFMLYDHNGDGFICPRDVFAIFQKQLDTKIEKDVLEIGKYTSNNEGREQQMNQEFKIEHVVIQDDFLTIKDYEVLFKKLDQPFLRATNKKDTGFAKTFAVLDHREKVRSKRRELNQKKTMYNELFGQIVQEIKHTAFIGQQDYKLNFTFLYQIFGTRPTQLFQFFIGKVLGVSHQPQ